MENSQIRKIAKQKMRGKLGKAILLSVINWGITFLIGLVLGFVPLIGSLIASIISVPLSFGWMKHFISLENGEHVGFIDFIRHGMENFGKVWCSYLWIALKCVLPIIVLIIGGVLMNVVNEIVGGIIVLIGVVWLIILGYKYCLINYTIAYDKSNLKASELVKKSGQESKGHIWKFLCIGIYYALIMILLYAAGGTAMGVAIAILPKLAFLFMIAYYVLILAGSVYFSILCMAACNEFYKINLLGIENDNIPNFDNTPKYEESPINPGQSW